MNENKQEINEREIIKNFYAERCAAQFEWAFTGIRAELGETSIESVERTLGEVTIKFYPNTSQWDVDYFSNFIDGFEAGYRAGENRTYQL